MAVLYIATIHPSIHCCSTAQLQVCSLACFLVCLYAFLLLLLRLLLLHWHFNIYTRGGEVSTHECGFQPPPPRIALAGMDTGNPRDNHAQVYPLISFYPSGISNGRRSTRYIFIPYYTCCCTCDSTCLSIPPSSKNPQPQPLAHRPMPYPNRPRPTVPGPPRSFLPSFLPILLWGPNQVSFDLKVHPAVHPGVYPPGHPGVLPLGYTVGPLRSE